MLAGGSSSVAIDREYLSPKTIIMILWFKIIEPLDTTSVQKPAWVGAPSADDFVKWPRWPGGGVSDQRAIVRIAESNHQTTSPKAINVTGLSTERQRLAGDFDQRVIVPIA